jgi:hypothetical protein
MKTHDPNWSSTAICRLQKKCWFKQQCAWNSNLTSFPQTKLRSGFLLV